MSRNGHVPDGWRRVRLGDIAEIVMGQSPPASTINDEGDGLPFIQGNAEYGARHPSPVKWCNSPWKRARAGDVLMSVRAPVGALNIADRDLAIGRGVCAVRFTGVESKYGWQAIQVAVSQFRRLAQGSTFTAVGRDAVAGLTLEIPGSAAEERTIGETLDSIDEAIERTETVIVRAAEAKQALAHELLTRGLPGRHTRFKHTAAGEIPDGWEVARIGELSTFVTSGSRGWAKHYRTDGRAKFLRITNVKRGSVLPVLDDLQWVEPPLDAEGRRTLVRPGDLLISITADLGATCVAPDELGEAYVNQHLALVRLDASRVLPWFAGYFLAGPGQAQFQMLMDQGAKAGLNLSSIRRLALPVPPMDEQRTIVSVLQASESRIEREAQQLVRWREAKEHIARALLAGEVRIPDEKGRL